MQRNFPGKIHDRPGNEELTKLSVDQPAVGAPLELTVATSSNDILGKTFHLHEGKIQKHSVAHLAYGKAQTCELLELNELPKLIGHLSPNQAILTGTFDIPSCKLTIRQRLNARMLNNGFRARTSDCIAQPRRGLLLFDYDENEHMPEALRCDNPTALMQKLASIPALNALAYIGAQSSSAGITIDATGEQYKNTGLHVYIEAVDIDLTRFRRYLEVNLWRAGLGYIGFARNGALLTRYIVDTSVLSPERLIFETEPLLSAGLSKKERSYQSGPGIHLSGNFELTDNDIQEFDASVEKAKRHPEIIARSEKIRSKYIDEQSVIYGQVKGITVEEARGIVSKARDTYEKGNTTLHADFIIDTGHNFITVRELLDRHEEFDGKSLPDPIEGRSYGMSAATFFYTEDFDPRIHSFAHGRETIFNLSEFRIESTVRVEAEK
jgi:hypothetical protein